MDTTETTPKNHLLITGLVRTGTTFLIAYYSRLGFSTGFPTKIVDQIMSRHNKFHGGLEVLNHLTYRKKLQEIEVIKEPWSYADRSSPPKKIENFKLIFNYIIITFRDFTQYAQSVEKAARLRHKKLGEKKYKERYEKAFAAAPQKMQTLKKWANKIDSIIIKVKFPDSIYNFEYLWSQLQPTFSIKNISKEKAYKHWLALRNPNYVNFK